MSLLQTLVQAQQEARKNKQSEKLSVLQMALSAIQNEKINAQKDDVSDEDIINVLKRQIKQLKDANNDFKTGGRDDLVAQNNKEIDILSDYVPAELSEDIIEQTIQAVIAKTNPVGPQDFGKVMSAAMAEFKGQADGQRVSDVVKRLIAS